MTPLELQIAQFVDATCDSVAARAAALSDQHGESTAACHALIVKALKGALHEMRPDVADSRTALWRVRIMLQREAHGETVAADTAPDKPFDQPGDLLIRGLPAVADELAALAAAFHTGKVIRGLGAETLRHSLKGFRPSLSRLRGDATWRPRYTVADPDTDSALGSLRGVHSAEPIGWLAHVHIVREREAGAAIGA